MNQQNNPVLDIKPGTYIDPFDNLAQRSKSGMWNIWAVDEDGNEGWRYSPEPRKLDAMIKMFIFIEDL